MTDEPATTQNPSPADVYEDDFVPVLFEPWAIRLCEWAELKPGQQVLDVATGSGVVARKAAERIAPSGTVVGTDPNELMIETARRVSPELQWVVAPAEKLPFDDDTFDVTLCQYGLMFFEDKPGGIAEMIRVTKPGGRVLVSVWDSFDNVPAFGALVGILVRLFGEETGGKLRVPFSLGNTEEVRAIFGEGGAPNATFETHTDVAVFPSVRDWMTSIVRGWLDFANPTAADDFENLVREAEKELAPFVNEKGEAESPSSAHIFTVTVD